MPGTQYDVAVIGGGIVGLAIADAVLALRPRSRVVVLEKESQLAEHASGRNSARVADTVARWLDWTEANRRIYLGTIAPGEDIADPEVRRVVADLRGRAVALLATFHADIAQDSPRLRLRTGVLDRPEPRRDAAVATVVWLSPSLRRRPPRR